MIDIVRAKTTLEAALELIKDKARWSQRAFARRKDGFPIDANAERACAWCALGAVQRASGCDYVPIDELEILDDEAAKMGKRTIVALNDEGTHDDVVEVFKRAIAACEEAAKA